MKSQPAFSEQIAKTRNRPPVTTAADTREGLAKVETTGAARQVTGSTGFRVKVLPPRFAGDRPFGLKMGFQKFPNALKFQPHVRGQFRHVSQAAFVAPPLQFTEQRHEDGHAAGGAGPNATVGKPPYFFRQAGLDGGGNLFDLQRGLLQIQFRQFAQGCLVAAGDSFKLRHIHGERRFLFAGWLRCQRSRRMPGIYMNAPTGAGDTGLGPGSHIVPVSWLSGHGGIIVSIYPAGFCAGLRQARFGFFAGSWTISGKVGSQDAACAPIAREYTSTMAGDSQSVAPLAQAGVASLTCRQLMLLPPELQAGTQVMSLLGVDYVHLKTSDGGDLYLTQFGLPFREHLRLENWFAPEWFEAKRERLRGTGTVYKVPTRLVNGWSLQLVVKWSRVGEDVPLDTLTVNKFIHAEFNSPFEEFALLMELRKGENGPPGIRIRTQQPLAIYVPSKRLQLWQTGRSEHRIRAKVTRHPDVEIDILRQYVVVYGWIKGLDAVETAEHLGFGGNASAEFLARITSLVTHELRQKGYHVIDMKPAHIILRPMRNKALLRDQHGQIAYAVVDYELLERTPEHEQAVRSFNRKLYLTHMAHRFDADTAKPVPEHLHATNLLGVDYVTGRAESTGGLLWVVGRDPDLFNYFLPERWRRTPNKALSSQNQVFHTCTKDNVLLVWRVSRMGDLVRLKNPGANLAAARAHGFNSPFEEFALALHLSRHGIRTIYPRAIYMTGSQREPAGVRVDERRYASLAHLLTPDGEPAIRRDYEYITIWGFWNGPDELLAAHDGSFYSSFNAKHACAEGLISRRTMEQLVTAKAAKLAQCGLEDLNLKPDHLLISFDSEGKLVLDTAGNPEVRLCNFEFVRHRSG